MKHKHWFSILALGISVGGFLCFYFIPFLASFWYAVTNNPIQREFVGMKNFTELFSNEFFLLGFKNTLYFMVLSIPVGMLLSLVLALTVKMSRGISGVLTLLFLIPLILPSASIANYWLDLYVNVLNWIRSIGGMEAVYGLGIWESRFFMVSIYIWKFMGYNMVLFQAGLYGIPEEYYQCASLFGAGSWQRFWYITRVYLTPSFFIVFIMSFVNSFKIFREIYFVYGGYPEEGMYLLQHFMNSTLISLNYQKMVSAVYLLTLLVAGIVITCFTLERRISSELTM